MKILLFIKILKPNRFVKNKNFNFPSVLQEKGKIVNKPRRKDKTILVLHLPPSKLTETRTMISSCENTVWYSLPIKKCIL